MSVLDDFIHDELLQFISLNPESSSGQIHAHFSERMSLAALKRALKAMVEEKKISVSGAARSTRYSVIRTNRLRSAIDVDVYFSKEQDERDAQRGFNFDIWHDLNTTPMFNAKELAILND